VCSLPPKLPQRPAPCSVLFVADPRTGRVEEVSEGVDYGVRKRTVSQGGARAAMGVAAPGAKGAELAEEEKFLKGVRICKDCRPVIL
jgi:rabenosyn-5